MGQWAASLYCERKTRALCSSWRTSPQSSLKSIPEIQIALFSVQTVPYIITNVNPSNPKQILLPQVQVQDNAAQAQAGHSLWPAQPKDLSFGQSPMALGPAPGQSQPAIGGYKPSQPTPSQACVSA